MAPTLIRWLFAIARILILTLILGLVIADTVLGIDIAYLLVIVGGLMALAFKMESWVAKPPPPADEY